MRYTPLVSIIVNNYNYGHFLSEAIDSALAQTYTATEVIVVDDGSTDDSAEIIAGYGEQIIPVLKENGGQASAFNAGFAKSRGDVICFLDADDVFYENKVAETLRFLRSYEAETKDVLLFHDLEVVDKGGSSLGTLELSKRGYNYPPNLYQYALEHKYIPYVAGPTSGLAMTRSLAERIFPLPDRGVSTSADNFIVRAASLLGDVYEADIVLSKYRVHGENRWYGNRTPKTEAFINIEQSFLNLRLKESNKEPTMSFFDSTYARRWYKYHRRCGDLLRLAFKVSARRLSPNNVWFSAKTVLSAVLLLLRPPHRGGRNTGEE
jgi:glycosyltransferase involved in cell wall biosynthesis